MSSRADYLVQYCAQCYVHTAKAVYFFCVVEHKTDE